jgi:hypothetical protein
VTHISAMLLVRLDSIHFALDPTGLCAPRLTKRHCGYLNWPAKCLTSMSGRATYEHPLTTASRMGLRSGTCHVPAHGKDQPGRVGAPGRHGPQISVIAGAPFAQPTIARLTAVGIALYMEPSTLVMMTLVKLREART